MRTSDVSVSGSCNAASAGVAVIGEGIRLQHQKTRDRTGRALRTSSSHTSPNDIPRCYPSATSDVLELYSPNRPRKRSMRYFNVSYHIELPHL
jgi:hypothetical protein